MTRLQSRRYRISWVAPDPSQPTGYTLDEDRSGGTPSRRRHALARPARSELITQTREWHRWIKSLLSINLARTRWTSKPLLLAARSFPTSASRYPRPSPVYGLTSGIALGFPGQRRPSWEARPQCFSFSSFALFCGSVPFILKFPTCG